MTRLLSALAIAAAIIISGCAASVPAEAQEARGFVLAAGPSAVPLPPAKPVVDRLPAYVAPLAALPAQPAAPVAPVVNVSVPEQPAPTVVVHAAPATQVQITWGEWVSELAKIAAGLAGPLGLFFLSMVKGLPGVMLRAYLTEAKINELAGYAVNAVEGATKDKALTIDLGNEVLATAVRYANDTLPKKTIAMLGGVEGIRAKVLAKLNLEAGANADALSA